VARWWNLVGAVLGLGAGGALATEQEAIRISEITQEVADADAAPTKNEESRTLHTHGGRGRSHAQPPAATRPARSPACAETATSYPQQLAVSCYRR
jgi:uncharacterized protein HemX